MSAVVGVAGLAAPSGRETCGQESQSPQTVVKRDSTTVPYSWTKIWNAVHSCLINQCKMAKDKADNLAATVADQVERVLYGTAQVHVERIQDIVEQQLMALGHHEAAREYILYREQRRVAREEEKKVDPEVQRLFQASNQYFSGVNRHLQITQHFDKFARFRPELGRRETWPESVDRVMAYTRKHMESRHPGIIDEATWDELRTGLLLQQAAPSMRLVQMAGPPLERCQVGAYNCAFLFLDEPRAFAEDLYCLMQGTGVGFSVEHRHAVDKWPRIKRQRGGTPDNYLIPDTTEGWCDALKDGITRWVEGGDYQFDSSQIRPAGAILRTKGGRSSGPQPLKECLAFARNTILARQGERLTSTDLHDIACMNHRVGQMGGVRRASGISFSDLDDPLMRDAKRGAFWHTAPYRDQANNSAVYEEQPSPVEFMEEWLALAKSGSGERGIFNFAGLRRQLPRRRKRTILRSNPCGEIFLRHKQFCNLSIVVLRPGLSVEEVRRRVRLATTWGTIQATMTRFNYLSDDWRKNCEDERLLGVDLLGHLDWEHLRPGASGREELLESLKAEVLAVNTELSTRIGINISAAVTCGKPSGDSSAFFDTAAGFKPHHGEHYLRRIRLNTTNPVATLLAEAGVPYATDYNKTGMLVFEFPCRAPEGGILLNQQTALEQLENWKTFKLHWTEHNPSITVYVRDEEWLEVGHWVYQNWDIVGGLAFLPYFGGNYPLAPYETISVEEYTRRTESFPEIDWARLTLFEQDDMTELSQQFACTGGACEM